MITYLGNNYLSNEALSLIKITTRQQITLLTSELKTKEGIELFDVILLSEQYNSELIIAA